MIVKLIGVPAQVPPAFVKAGVTVIVAVTGIMPAFSAVNDGRSPDPAAASPIAVLEFVHENTVPGTVPVNAMLATTDPAHTVWLCTTATVGVGLTVSTSVSGLPVQVTPPLV